MSHQVLLVLPAGVPWVLAIVLTFLAGAELAPIKAEGAATQWASPSQRLSCCASPGDSSTVR